jgi:hypothetical protein
MSWTSFIQILIGIIVGVVGIAFILAAVIDLVKTLRNKKEVDEDNG